MAEFILSGFADEADVNLDGQIKILKKTDISFVEMRGVDGISLIDCTDEKVNEINEKLKASNIKISSVGSYIGKIKITDDFKPHLDKFKRAIEIAQTLGAPNIRIFSFFLPQDENPAVYRDEVMERMTAFLDASDGSGVSCCHENEKDIYGDIPIRVLDMHQTLGPRLKGIFDAANYIQCNVKNILESLKLLLPYIEYMHIKDARFADLGVVPAGFGDGEIRETIELFSIMKGQRFLSIEPHLKVFDGYDKLGDGSSIKKSNEFAYKTSQDAFLAATEATKNILKSLKFYSNINNEGGYSVWTR